MSALRFGLYFIPDHGDLYDTGCKVIGYDIRAGRPVPTYDFMQPAWASLASPYGFHASITDAIDIDAAQLDTITQRVRNLIACLQPGQEYTLTSKGVQAWGGTLLVLELLPNRPVELLHDLLVSQLHPLGTGSAYSQAYAAGELSYPANSADAMKIKHFYSPYIFDRFRPHFTLANPFTGTAAEYEALHEQLHATFQTVSAIVIRRLALVVKNEADTYYRIHSQFALP